MAVGNVIKCKDNGLIYFLKGEHQLYHSRDLKENLVYQEDQVYLGLMAVRVIQALQVSIL